MIKESIYFHQFLFVSSVLWREFEKGKKEEKKKDIDLLWKKIKIKNKKKKTELWRQGFSFCEFLCSD